MSALRAVLVAWLVAASLAAPVLAAPPTATDGTSVQPATRVLQDDTNNSTATVGEQISGFMAQQTSQADGTVETGMWSAAYDAGDESRKVALVDQRTRGLTSEVAALQAERRELIAARQAGEISRIEFQSRMSALAGRYASLLVAINETESRAQAAGANVTAIQNLRDAATEAVGPWVVASAGNAVVSPPGLTNNTTVGPPVDVPGTNGTAPPGNGAAANGTVGNGVAGNGTDGNGGGGNGVGGRPAFVLPNPQVSSDVDTNDPA